MTIFMGLLSWIIKKWVCGWCHIRHAKMQDHTHMYWSDRTISILNKLTFFFENVLYGSSKNKNITTKCKCGFSFEVGCTCMYDERKNLCQQTNVIVNFINYISLVETKMIWWCWTIYVTRASFNPYAWFVNM